ncbi:MerC domain-containing protein [Natronospira bacteriovora]|uniref:MerC domain-containing protein n=1 Tax=Natronospira bacteriovora TaxID=3069753 RepID=A0ABU0W7R3_9GAMM|nr:MerC domain-containing protein [Natronospira sp. AB-CW4]MDQ2069953.1 MerC domain-containing protein [Natronospira sp. AB-CW4]
MKEVPANKARLDFAAIGMSLLCVLHCTALPVMAAAMPWIAALGIVDDWFHRAILLLVIPVSGWALGLAWRRRGETGLLLTGMAGMALMVLATLEFAAWHTNTLEVVLTLGGAALLSAAHLLNLRNFLRPNTVTDSMVAGHPRAWR